MMMIQCGKSQFSLLHCCGESINWFCKIQTDFFLCAHKSWQFLFTSLGARLGFVCQWKENWSWAMIARLFVGHDAASRLLLLLRQTPLCFYRRVNQQSRINVSKMEQIRFFCSQNVFKLTLICFIRILRWIKFFESTLLHTKLSRK